MGAGDFPAGAGLAGADPVYLPVPPAPPLTPRAVLYDPSVKQYLLRDARGNAIDVHPIDQIVATRLTTQQGQSASAPTLGTQIRAKFALAGPARHQQIAYQEVASALSDLLSNGDVKLWSVSLQIDPSNLRELITAIYTNLRDPNTNPNDPSGNAQTSAGF